MIPTIFGLPLSFVIGMAIRSVIMAYLNDPKRAQIRKDKAKVDYNPIAKLLGLKATADSREISINGEAFILARATLLTNEMLYRANSKDGQPNAYFSLMPGQATQKMALGQYIAGRFGVSRPMAEAIVEDAKTELAA